MDSEYQSKLAEEALAFDRQILERIANGHLPDLRRMRRCEWFYNNVWRDPVYADMLYGQKVRQIIAALEKYIHKSASNVDILEVACGPGHIALELSRNGCNVTGLDASSCCIDVARKVAEEDPYIGTRGPLDYVCSDFFAFQLGKQYDMVVFSSALHHFGDLKATLRKVDQLLKPKGLIFAGEPTRQQLSDAEAAIIHLITGLLSLGGNFYKEVVIPMDDEQLEESLKRIKNEFAYKDQSGHNVQSPLDNEATYSDMSSALNQFFEEMESRLDFAFFDRIVAGIRLGSVEKEHEVARWILRIDKLLCCSGSFTPGHFHFIGRKKECART